MAASLRASSTPRRRRRRCIFFFLFFSLSFCYLPAARRRPGIPSTGKEVGAILDGILSQRGPRSPSWPDGRPRSRLAPRRQLCRRTSRRFGKTRVVCRTFVSSAQIVCEARPNAGTAGYLSLRSQSAPLCSFVSFHPLGLLALLLLLKLLCFLSRSVTAILGRLIVDDPSPAGHRLRPDGRSSVSAA